MSAAWPIASHAGPPACQDAATAAVRVTIGDTLGPFSGVLNDPLGTDMSGWVLTAFLRRLNAPSTITPVQARWINAAQRSIEVSAPPATTAALPVGLQELVVRLQDGVNQYTLVGALVDFAK